MNRTLRLLLPPLVLTLHGLSLHTSAQPPRQASHPAAIKLASGSGIITLPSAKAPFFDITKYGAVSDGPALANQAAINAAIDAASAAGHGTVLIPSGTFKTYSIRLKSNVGIHFVTSSSVLRAAIPGTGAGQDGGFYDAPEKNPFVGLQDGGHSHWADSLIYGIGVSNIMISGPGLIDGSYADASGTTVNVLSSGDSREGPTRNTAGQPGPGNKAIALKNATNIVFRDFRIKNGGHFAILGSGVDRWTIDGIIVDTNRDAIDIDTTRNMTIRNSVFNSLTDDAIVLKGSFGIGRYLTSKNILIEHDTVSGYDPGSVLDKTYSTEKLVASDRDGPTGRVKFGTEGTNGLDTVTIRHVTFDRSRGFALESVDGAELKDIVFTDVHMKNISSSPIFIFIGDRGRAPVTGISSSEAISPANTIRLTDTGWVLPNLPETYSSFPAVRYIPSYNKSSAVNIPGADRQVTIVDPTAPTRLNPNSIHPEDPLFANAVGVGFASIHNITIRNVTVEDADPRYPILINGLVGHPVENVNISNVSVEYRGGLKMSDAIEQRQINQSYTYRPYHGAEATQSLPWLVNPFFSKNESLLPRVSWNPALADGKGAWTADPYNVPEMTREYPEPSILGILPAYGLYARHVKRLTLANVSVKYKIEDERPAVVLDDVTGVSFSSFTATTKAGVPALVKVTNTRKRDADLEYVKDTPYQTTTVTGLITSAAIPTVAVTVSNPSPGTPPDSLYTYPTAPTASNPYAYQPRDSATSVPLTVYRPSFESLTPQTVHAGQTLTFAVNARTPATAVTLSYTAEGLPTGATFDAPTRTFLWTPSTRQLGIHTIRFVVNDGVLPNSKAVPINVLPAAVPAK